jgi:hypothetical protein
MGFIISKYPVAGVYMAQDSLISVPLPQPVGTTLLVAVILNLKCHSYADIGRKINKDFNFDFLGTRIRVHTGVHTCPWHDTIPYTMGTMC